MDIRQSENYAKYMNFLGWQVEDAGDAKVFIRHLPIVSFLSVIKVQRPGKIDLTKLEEIAKRHHALFVKIEPVDFTGHQHLATNNYVTDNWPLLPTKTLVLDIPGPLGDFFEKLPKDTRYEYKQSLKRRVEVKESDDIELFYHLLQETMKIGHWEVPIKKEVTSLWRSFQPGNSQLLIARCQNLPVGGCLLIWEGDTAHYMYAALTAVGRKHSGAYGTLFKAVEFLKTKGVRKLDLEGIYDERYPGHTKNWKGFTQFKMGWGGKVVEYPGSYIKYFNPFARLLFSIGDLV